MDVRAFGSWCPHRNACFSRISRAWPKFLPPDVRRDIRVDVRGISGPKTYSLGCFSFLSSDFWKKRNSPKIPSAASTHTTGFHAPILWVGNVNEFAKLLAASQQANFKQSLDWCWAAVVMNHASGGGGDLLPNLCQSRFSGASRFKR